MALTETTAAHGAFRASPWLALCLATCTLLQACSVAGPRDTPLPRSGKTVVDVYEEHLKAEGIGAPTPRDRLRGTAPAEPAAGAGATPASAHEAGGAPRAVQGSGELLDTVYREQIDPMQQRFARLPNPDLVMYVHPHLSRNGHPVPGYLTVFPMYERVEYALPGEVAPSQQRMTQNLTQQLTARAAEPTRAQPGAAPQAGELPAQQLSRADAAAARRNATPVATQLPR